MDSQGWRGTITIVACIAILAVVNLFIAGKERLLAGGRVVYMELAPVDPRSIMQGDYMALNYQVAGEVMRVLPRKTVVADGRIVVSLDERSIASFSRFENDRPLTDSEVYMRYRVRNGRFKFASDAFFFQEGQAGQYEGARYGRFRVDDNGELLLTALHGENLEALGTETG